MIGPLPLDDGYNLTIARVSDDAGYAANYFRYFGATEAPFDWYQSVLAHLAAVSTDSVWMRIPATLAGIATWLILSRWALPRLGRAIAATGSSCGPRVRCSWRPGCRSTTVCGPSR